MKASVVASSLAAACILTLALPARAEQSGLNFDQGINVSDILKQAKETTAQDKSVVAASFGPIRYDRDCRTVTFDPADQPASGPIPLRSMEWVTECTNSGGGTVPGPGGHPVPVPPTQNCWERPGYTYTGDAQVTLRDRQTLFPWEYDKFQVCLEGPWFSLYTVATAYDYKLVQGGSRDGDFILAPIKKTPMKPDAAGIVAQGLSSGMALTLKDKWASYYKGEQTVLKIELRKEVSFWPDQTVLEKEISVAPADTYAVNLMDYAKEFSQQLEPGKKYYVRYSFQRIGKISKPDLMKVGDTEKVAYQPATLAAAY